MSDVDEDQITLLDKSSPTRARHSRPSTMFHLPRCRITLPLLAGAILSALLLYLSLFSFVFTKPTPSLQDPDPVIVNDRPLVSTTTVYATKTVTETITEVTKTVATQVALPFPLAEEGILKDKTLDELKDMVKSTNGYFVRDWSLGLGWNNMRYIVEAALEHAHLLNRTLVLPSFVYARACEYENAVCANYARMMNRGDAIGIDEWSSLPTEKQMAWRIPFEVMIDVPHLRSRHPVLLVSEYLRIQGLSPNLEKSNGAWDREKYHSGLAKPSLFVIPNSGFDPEDIVRVDDYPDTDKPLVHTSSIGERYDEILRQKAAEAGRKWLDWGVAQLAIYETGIIRGEEEFIAALKQAGWAVLHTWDGAVGIDFIKSVVKPIRQVARNDSLRGFAQDFSKHTEDVLLLEGEVHLNRKPGSVRFVTEAGRDNFARFVLQDIRVTSRVRDLAASIEERMTAMNHGRSWVGAHMRRGDFVTAGWSMEPTVQQHFERIKNRLNWGRQVLEHIHGTIPMPYDVPDVMPNTETTSRDPPLPNDAIYLATDERDPRAIQYLHENQAVLFQDMLTLDDRRIFGWPIMFSDVIALVEQTVLGHGAAYFYGHAMSSVAGGILNLRAAQGMDYRTALID